MTTNQRLKPILLVLAGALLFGACGAGAEIALTQDVEPSSASAQAPAVDQPDVAAPVAEADTAMASEATSSDSVSSDGAAPGTALVTFGGEEMSFDLWVCAANTPEFMSVAGLPLGATPADSEFHLAYELAMFGDGEDAEYENTVSLIFGNNTWKAGTLTSSLGDESWGALDWNRDGDIVTGTALMVHSWGLDSENSEPRDATFVVNCT
jgi:hypothetical protein